MDIDTIVTYFLAIIPSVASVVTAIATLIKVFKKFDDLKKSVKESTDLQQFKDQLNRVLQENYELKEMIAELVEYSKTHPVITTKKED